ncbi:MAG: EscU/YscU/HrcU family type III secretion system export apparatus switch protein [Acidimicrobiales bacterium]|nr:EscU/YscU/HrcU family type III secretion system export apparatus switch protein [Acidimicrobiales bacterium]
MASEERTEKATPKKKRDLRKKGQVARSAELPQAVVLAIVVALLPMTVRHLVNVFTVDFATTINQASSPTPMRAGAVFGQSLIHAAGALAPMTLALAFASVGAQLVMSGPRPNFNLLSPKFERISPKAGIKRMLSKQVVWELIKTTGKVGLLSLLVYGVWESGVADILRTPRTLDATIAATGKTITSMLWRVVALSMVIGLADAVVSKRRHLKTSKMTKQEVRDEYKQSEGSPQAKSAIRSRAQKLSRSRMIAAVAKADVILTNPTHFAVALKYEKGSPAPVVVAKGADFVAKKIREEASKHNVPIIENKPLARALFKAVEVGDVIPANFYRAVAEVLAVVFRTKKNRAPRLAPLRTVSA